MFSSDNLSGVLRAVASSLQAPVMILLILLIIITVFMLGSLVAELFSERIRMKADLPQLTDQLKKHQGRLEKTIRDSGLLKRQIKALLEVTSHKDLTPAMRESLAAELLHEEKMRYDGIVRITDLISRLGPMLGLMGTLIPLGPGIIALGRGDTLTLSQSLLVAFDTTVAGLASAAVAYVISAVRKRWYGGYMSGLEMCMECVVELESSDWEERTGGYDDGSVRGSRSMAQDYRSDEAGGYDDYDDYDEEDSGGQYDRLMSSRNRVRREQAQDKDSRWKRG